MLRKISIFTSILSLLFSIQVNAQDTIVRKVIITPVPQGSCNTIAAHWEGDIWVADQSVCKYENRTEGAAWVQAYWSCTTYDSATGDCKTWVYQPGHWLQTLP